MTYTIKMDHKEKHAGKIILVIKEMEQELDRRYQEGLKNPQEGKSWEEVKAVLLGR